MSPAGVILAAGASRRMGSPKALLPLDGEAFLDRLVRIFSVHCPTVIVVLGHHAEAIRAGLHHQPVIATNPDPGRGQLSSLQCGLALLPPEIGAFLFTPVDYPAIAESTISALLSAITTNSEALLAIPRYQGRRGHPVACRASLAGEFLALPPTAQARDIIHNHLGSTLYVDTHDPGILTDIDDPAAYARLLHQRAAV